MKKYIPAMIVLSPIITDHPLAVLKTLAAEPLRLLADFEPAIGAIVTLSQRPSSPNSATRYVICLDNPNRKRVSQFEVSVNPDGSLCETKHINGAIQAPKIA